VVPVAASGGLLSLARWMMTILVLVELRRESESWELKKTAAGKRR
jgi:hypothetical protein